LTQESHGRHSKTHPQLTQESHGRHSKTHPQLTQEFIWPTHYLLYSYHASA